MLLQYNWNAGKRDNLLWGHCCLRARVFKNNPRLPCAHRSHRTSSVAGPVPARMAEWKVPGCVCVRARACVCLRGEGVLSSAMELAAGHQTTLLISEGTCLRACCGTLFWPRSGISLQFGETASGPTWKRFVGGWALRGQMVCTRLWGDLGWALWWALGPPPPRVCSHSPLEERILDFAAEPEQRTLVFFRLCCSVPSHTDGGCLLLQVWPFPRPAAFNQGSITVLKRGMEFACGLLLALRQGWIWRPQGPAPIPLIGIQFEVFYIILFIFGCAKSSLLHRLFWQAEATL